MNLIKISLNDGKIIEVPKGSSLFDIAFAISPRLAKEALAAELNGEVVDLSHVVESDATVKILKFEDPKGQDVFRHTSTHILAHAVKRLYPDAKLGIGPVVDRGFYYDFDNAPSFTKEQIEKIEKEVERIIQEDNAIERFELPREEAIALMRQMGEDYKVELIQELPQEEAISFYRQGDFTDLCRGPHVPSTGKVKNLKILASTSSYWKGDEKNKQLQRLYGISFVKEKDMQNHLKRLEEAKLRDHNKLGREMGLFTTVDVIGQGLPLLMPKGAKIVQQLQRFVEDEEEKRGYELTKTPLIAKSDLYKISGHWDHYRDGMFILNETEPEEKQMALRPMTCPFQFFVYKAQQKSYRDLPVRLAETSTLFRNESSGEMHGLIRVRQFTISEAHLMVTEEQLEEEFKGVLDLIQDLMKVLGTEGDFTYQFSKWDPNNKAKYVGDEATWEKTQRTMKQILDNLGMDYKEAEGEAAFYGPKLDIQFKNVHGKEDTIITVQIDFSLAQLFDMTYTDASGQKKNPIIIHRTSIGCYERTLAMLIEKYAGAFPLWLAPVQVKVLPISDQFNEYGQAIVKRLKHQGIRAELDSRSEKIGYKIREARMEKVPYMFVVGQKEESDQSVAVRRRGKGEIGSYALCDIEEVLKQEIQTKDLGDLSSSQSSPQEV